MNAIAKQGTPCAVQIDYVKGGAYVMLHDSMGAVLEHATFTSGKSYAWTPEQCAYAWAKKHDVGIFRRYSAQ